MNKITDKIKNRAFTLIELLAVIIILAFIALIALPIILNIVNKARKSAFLDSGYGIIDSARIYYSESLFDGGITEDKVFLFDGKAPEGLHYSGTSPKGGMMLLKKDGSISLAIYNENWCAKKAIDESEVILTDYEEGKCIIPENAKDPIIVLNGDSKINLKEGDAYVELGATARTFDGDSLDYTTQITIADTIVSSIESVVVGTIYKITYTATSNHKTAVVTRTVHIVDGKGPEIMFTENPVTIRMEDVQDYDLLTGVSLRDNEDGDIEVTKETVKTSGSLGTMPGEYLVIYEAMDSSGNKTTKDRTFIVVDLTSPEITFEPIEQITYVKEKAIKVTVTDNVNVKNIHYVLIKDNVKEEAISISSGDIITINNTGIYQIEVTATDDSDNVQTQISGIYKIDTIKPEIVIPENTYVKITDVLTYHLMEGVIATDNTGIAPTIASSGSLAAALGEYTITYIATDEAGNEAKATRTIMVVEAEGPVLGQSNSGSEEWTKKQTVKITAVDNDSNISSFTYKVTKDGITGSVQSGTLNGKNAEALIVLDTTGIYDIDYTGIDSYGNSTNMKIGPFKIDETNPILGSATPTGTLGSNGWYTSNITFNIINGTDAHSGHSSTLTVPGSITSNTNSSGTVVTIKTTDKVGNTVTGNVGTYKVDKIVPTITTSGTATITIGDSNALTSYFTINSVTSYSGSTTVCRDGTSTSSKVVSNTNSLSIGTHTIRCTVTRGNGKTAYADKTIVVKDKEPEKPQITSNGLLPVKWNGSKWIVADKNNPSGAYQWYDYSKQMWANAVAVTSEYRNLSVGAEVPDGEVYAYFVWIPRYEYQYTNLGTNYAGGTKEQPGGININFISTTKTTPSPNYKIHPAFTWTESTKSGFWVGKYETTGSASLPLIRPNSVPIIQQTTSEQWETARKFGGVSNPYGISGGSRIIKNSEWGAVAYLSQSKYGKYGNSDYSGVNKEIYINNYWSEKSTLNTFRTGCSSGSPNAAQSSSCAYSYEQSPGGTGASTTGTIYGIYDMNGGLAEAVMGGYNENVGASGFPTFSNEEVYDKFTDSNLATACSGGICYGHAFSETAEWYNDTYGSLGSTFCWLKRGGYMESGSNAGIFAVANDSGSASYRTFRVALNGL